MSKEHQNDWDDFLDPVLFGIRTSVQESTKYTPFFLMHGREAKFPLENEKTTNSVLPDTTQEGDTYDLQATIDRLTHLKETVFGAASDNISNSQNKQKKQYDKRKGFEITSGFKVGDIVLRLNMLKRTKKGHKHEDSWLGPYKIVDVSKYGTCQLQCISTGNKFKRRINKHQLKLYKGIVIYLLYLF